MSKILSLARSFGKTVSIGKELLEKEGHKLYFPTDDCLPLNEKNIIALIKKLKIEGIVVGADKITHGILDALGSSKIVAKHGAGLDNIDIEYATKKNIAVTFTPEANVQSVAELAVGLMLCILRKIPKAFTSLKSGKWEVLMGREIYMKTIGVIGTGKIGSAVIQKLQGMGVNILAYDVIKSEQLNEMRNIKYVSLEELLASSDLITLHIPLNKNTCRLIGEKELGLMKPSAFLINTSRGEVINESALYKFLSSNKIAGAALDVWEHEPPKLLSEKLVKLDNVLPTPHIGAHTMDAVYRMGYQCAMSIVDYFNNKKPENLVNQNIWED